MARADSEEHLRARLDSVAAWSLGPGAGRERKRLTYLRVDLSRPGLGLDASGTTLMRGVDEVFFLASSVSFTMSEAQAPRSNVETVRHFLGLCSELRALGRLRALHYVSTAYVATTKKRVAAPSPADTEARFRNSYEYSKALAEQEIRDSGIPFSIYRPSIIVGSSRNGRAFGFDTVYNFMRSYARGRLPFLPSDPGHILDIVCSDYVCETIVALSRTRIGETFHICAGDTAPTIKEVYESIRRAISGFRGDDSGLELRFFPPELVEGIDTAPPGLASSRLRGASRLISAYLPFLSPGVPLFDITETVGATGLRPPSLEGYGERVWPYALEHDFGSPTKKGTAAAAARRSRASTDRRTDPAAVDGLLARTARPAPWRSSRRRARSPTPSWRPASTSAPTPSPGAGSSRARGRRCG
ncbi:SDR family oxidoreductase [Nocardiopsis sp. LOL_012]|uniref:SDR family oxidoreductase n=1 Tax=Nocardiopsis sp. LOL_012 TaxID=3345409 RepID=UPI003A8B19F5